MLQLLTVLLVFLQVQEFVPRLLWAQCQCHIAPNLSALGQYLPFILACDLLLHLAAPCPAFSPVVLLLPYLLSGCLVSHHTYAGVSWGHSPQYSPENPSPIWNVELFFYSPLDTRLFISISQVQLPFLLCTLNWKTSGLAQFRGRGLLETLDWKCIKRHTRDSLVNHGSSSQTYRECFLVGKIKSSSFFP